VIVDFLNRWGIPTWLRGRMEPSLRKDIEPHSHIDLFNEDDDPDSVIRALADNYGVSVRAMTIRLERLGYVAEI